MLLELFLQQQREFLLLEGFHVPVIGWNGLMTGLISVLWWFVFVLCLAGTELDCVCLSVSESLLGAR